MTLLVCGQADQVLAAEPDFHRVTPGGVVAAVICLVHLLHNDIRTGFDPLENDVGFPFVEPGTRLPVAGLERLFELANGLFDSAMVARVMLGTVLRQRRCSNTLQPSRCEAFLQHPAVKEIIPWRKRTGCV